MNKLLLTLAILTSTSSYAMPNPQVVALVNTAELGKYIGENIREIIGSSIELAKQAAPNRHYFLVTTSISINPIGREIDRSEKPIATLNMQDGATKLNCSRDIFAKVTADTYGEKRKISFSLSNSIRCE